MNRKQKQSGFTAVELLIAIVLLIIVSAVAVPFVLGTIQDYRLRTAAWQVAGDLRLARQKAVASGKAYRFTFNKMSASTDPNSYI
ncbi:MAG: prepilin-type N-terminal cleavage/methylation domain-containing protein, partial [candidate division NC10 bacterium]|nr:prepilin-type N-terminal cleavage/methylation domain-containing protein [candidate division NC10 bacterium]